MSQAAAPFGITVCGLSELEGHCATNASHVLSILDPDHPIPDAFGSYGEHERLELRFHDIVDPMPGRVLPQPEHVAAILRFGHSLLADPAPTRHLLVHCHAGISRSTAAMTMLLALALPDRPAAGILAMVHGIREKAWPNLRMIEFADPLLGRGGSLVAATHALHRLQLGIRPHIVDFMMAEGRQRELDAARAVPATAGAAEAPLPHR